MKHLVALLPPLCHRCSSNPRTPTQFFCGPFVKSLRGTHETMKSLAVLLCLGALVFLAACEGPAGPMGPPGPEGRPGSIAHIKEMLVELLCSDDSWELHGWEGSYVFLVPQVTHDRVLGVYVRQYSGSISEIPGTCFTPRLKAGGP